MGAAELTRGGSSDACVRGYTRTVLDIYVLLWAATVLVAVAVAALGAALIRHWLGLRLSPAATTAPSLLAVAGLAAHNLPVCGWPLLLTAAGADRGRRRRHFAHGMVVIAVAVNVSLVGAALGAYGTRLLPYVPQLPLEWLALAAGAAGWLCARTRAALRGVRVAVALTAAAVLGAAAIETYAVPHNPRGVAGGGNQCLTATYR